MVTACMSDILSGVDTQAVVPVCGDVSERHGDTNWQVAVYEQSVRIAEKNVLRQTSSGQYYQVAKSERQRRWKEITLLWLL